MFMVRNKGIYYPAYSREHKHSRVTFLSWLLATSILYIGFLTNAATAANPYYVDDANGNNSNPGTSELPWKSLNRAYTWYDGTPKVQDGDTVIVRNGDYGQFRENTDDGSQYHFHRNSWITYKAAPGHKPNLTSVSIKNADSAGDGQSYLIFDGFNITDGVEILNTAYVKILSCTIRRQAESLEGYYAPYFRPNRAAVSASSTHYITVQDNEISHAYRGIATGSGGGTNWLIKGNTIHHISEDGFSSPAVDNITIEDNHIYDLRRFTTAMTIYGTRTGTFIVGETVTMPGTNATGIVYSAGSYPQVYQTSQSTFYDCWLSNRSRYVVGQNSGATMNPITDVDPPHCDLFQIHGNTNGVTIRGNVLDRRRVDGIGSEDGQGFKLWVNVTNVTIENNLIDASKPAIIEGVNNLNMYNNTIYGSDGFELTAHSYNSVVNNMYNNLIEKFNHIDAAGGNYVRVLNHGNNIFKINPDGQGADYPFTRNVTESVVTSYSDLFVNIIGANNNFHLRNGSTAIDFGNAGYAPITDKDGSPRVGPPDAGCYEYTASDPNNLAPTADAGSDQTVTDSDGNGSESVTLDGSNSEDPDGTIISYVWYEGANQIATGQQPTVTLSVGTHNIILMVTDDDGATDTDTVTITVNGGNQAPTADAGTDQTLTDDDGNGSEPVILDASNSDDPDGTIVSYVWNEGAAQIATGQQPTVVLNVDTHNITLTVTDDDGATDTDTVTVTVNPGNQAPTADAGDDQTLTDDDGNGSEPVTLDASGSGDWDGTIVSYVWSEGANQIATGQQPTVALNVNTHIITLTVTDDDGATDTDTVAITVNPGNQAPTANAGTDQTLTDDDGNGSEPVTLDGSSSGDWDGTIISYVWSEAANQIATGQQPTVALNVGAHTITLTVTDNDGATDTDTVTITVNTVDTTSPTVTNRSPQADAIQVPLNTLVSLNITDSGHGVDADSVTIEVNGNVVYTGNMAKYNSAFGECYRIGTVADYEFIYQSNETFDFDRSVNVTVNASDLAGNAMDEYSYSFQTEMRSFGKNIIVDSDDLTKGGPVTVCDSSGNIWVAWHAGTTGNKDIYINKLTAGSEAFGNSIKLTNSDADQRNPAVAVGTDDKLYVAWQDSRNGNWDIYVSTSTDGVNFSAETRVSDSNDNQINPAIIVDSSLPNNVYIAWEDSRNGNQDIYIGVSNNGFVSTTTSQITSELSYQGEPAIAVDSDNTVYVVWTDRRNSGKNDVYGAASNSGPWTNIPIVTEEHSQSSPAIAIEAASSILHLVWADDRPGDEDIYYAKTTGGLPTSPLSGSSIIDDTTNAVQKRPVIAVAGSTGSNLRIYACWQDERNGDDDLYLSEINSGSGTNVFVGDDGTNTDQTEPTIGIDGHGQPYLAWLDGRNMNTDIYYAGSTFIEPEVLASSNISTSLTVTVGTPVNAIDSIDDVSVEVPQGAYLCDIKISISKIQNSQEFNLERFGGPYEFSPSGIEFIKPVTITIPYEVTGSENITYTAYWYNPLTNALSQQGITDIETIVISPTLHALRFKTAHFTQFFVVGSSNNDSNSIRVGGGGGCSMSPDSHARATELLLPYIGLAVAMVILKLRDRWKRKTCNTT